MKTHQGSCHCGAVEIEVTAELSEGMTCNCSICSRAGWTLVFCGESQVVVKKGEDHLIDYQFGKKKVHHPFCKTCGVRTFGYGAAPDGSKMFSVNARCLQDFDLESLTVMAYDGAAL